MEAKFYYSLKGPEQTQPYARNSPAVWIPSTTIRCDSPVRYLMDFPSPSEIINRFANKFVSIFVMRSDKRTATTITKKKKIQKDNTKLFSCQDRKTETTNSQFFRPGLWIAISSQPDRCLAKRSRAVCTIRLQSASYQETKASQTSQNILLPPPSPCRYLPLVHLGQVTRTGVASKFEPRFVREEQHRISLPTPPVSTATP